MRTMTLAEKLDTTKYNTPRLFWHQLNSVWQDDSVLDALVADETLCEGVLDAIEKMDAASMLCLCDRAEEAGIAAELCGLTRAGLKHFQK